MSAKNPFDLLGVAPNAGADEVRTAYIKRTKVLHPDRFDQSTQPVEWEMANNMLRELNEAYHQVNSQETARAEAGRPFHSSTYTDLGRTQGYWNEVTALFLRAVTSPITALNENNWSQHIADLNRYISTCFETQLSISRIDSVGVDPLAITARDECNNVLVRCSGLITQRLTLLKRAGALKDKYSSSWTVFCMRLSGKISDKEYEADQSEWASIDPRLIVIGNQFSSIEAELRECLQAIAIQLVAKYGNAFQA